MPLRGITFDKLTSPLGQGGTSGGFRSRKLYIDSLLLQGTFQVWATTGMQSVHGDVGLNLSVGFLPPSNRQSKIDENQ